VTGLVALSPNFPDGNNNDGNARVSQSESVKKLIGCCPSPGAKGVYLLSCVWKCRWLKASIVWNAS